MTLVVGTRLGPYEVTALLGSGGMAEVYRAHDVRLGRDVAIKILPEEIAADGDSLARFTREACTASALSHPHLVTIYDIGDAEIHGHRLHYIAMELIRGETLRFHLGHASRDVLLRYLACVADGLAKAHDAGVVHRDLKPENIMVSDDDFAKVVDFGLAKRAPGFLSERSTEHLTAEGFCVGTAGYMAPEQVRGERDIDGRADIFSLGCMLYEIIAKENPFDGTTLIDTLYRVLSVDPPPLPDAAIDAIVRRCIAKDRAARYASMREVAADVRTAMAAPASIAAIRRTTISSIAVLPFHNRSGNEEMRFLSDGIPEDIVRDLGRVAGLRVIASSSASRFRDTTDPQQAARELGVEAVLVGGLRTISGKVLVDAELVRAADGTALWGKKYTRDLTDVIELEQAIARDLCTELRLQIAPQSGRVPHPEAHAAYLRGRSEMAKETMPGLQSGIAYLHQAIEIDPDYALPYATLALVYVRFVRLSVAATRDSIRQAIALAKKALALDETLPEAHWDLALAAHLVGDQALYERYAARVLELNPNFAPAHAERVYQLVVAQRYEEAERAYRYARELDPLSPTVMTGYAALLLFLRQYDRAIEVLRAATQEFPESTKAWGYCAMVLGYAGKTEEAVAIMSGLAMDINPTYELWKGVILAWAGHLNEAREIADRADESARSRYVAPYYRAMLRCALGERDAALERIERGVYDGEYMFRWLPYDPAWDALRDDPRFDAFIEEGASLRAITLPLPRPPAV
jgi:serine/threonine protein kinase/tetratricopeptide (TPR) repeat protein